MNDTNQIPQSFEYTLLNEETKIIIEKRTLEIKNLMRLTAENIIDIGQKLTEVKEQLEHGTFQIWLRTEFEWSEQTARQFMQVYRWSETIENKNFVFSQLGTSALYLLAAPSTPPEARQEILNLVEIGEKITYTRAKVVVDRHKQTALVPVQEKQDKVKDIKILNTMAKTDSTLKPSLNQLFRLETEDLGCIVRLYQADELESTTELTVGATVKIKVGHRQGQIAKITAIMTDSQLSEVESAKTKASSFRKSQTSNIIIRTIDEVEALHENEHLIVSYGNVFLTAEGNPDILSAFIKQLQTNTMFVKHIFEQVLNQNTQAQL